MFFGWLCATFLMPARVLCVVCAGRWCLNLLMGCHCAGWSCVTDWKYIFCCFFFFPVRDEGQHVDEPFGLSSNFRIASSRTGAMAFCADALCVWVVLFWLGFGLFTACFTVFC